MTDIYIGATREKLVAELRRCADEIEAAVGGFAEARIFAQENLSSSEVAVDIVFSNDDMEGRPDVADSIFVDVVA